MAIPKISACMPDKIKHVPMVWDMLPSGVHLASEIASLGACLDFVKFRMFQILRANRFAEK